LQCPKRPAVYVGQTSIPFVTRLKEHQNAFRTNSGHSKYADHLLEENHTFGPIQNTMIIVPKIQKGMHLDTVEKFYIYIYIYIKLQNLVYS
jgi:hypothetical protein